MKILVIDDSQEQRNAAIEQLSEKHELIVISTYKEARKLLGGEKWRSLQAHDFDAVLTDLMMPAEMDCVEHKAHEFKGQLMPYGLWIALLALRNSSSTKVAIVSSGLGHHSHPMVFAAEPLSGAELNNRLKLYVGDHDVSSSVSDILIEHEGNHPSLWLKNWAKALKEIMNLKS